MVESETQTVKKGAKSYMDSAKKCSSKGSMKDAIKETVPSD